MKRKPALKNTTLLAKDIRVGDVVQLPSSPHPIIVAHLVPSKATVTLISTLGRTVEVPWEEKLLLVRREQRHES